MDTERLEWVAVNLAGIGCLEASIPGPVETAWSRADQQQREVLEKQIREIPDLFPGLKEAFWRSLGRPLI